MSNSMKRKNSRIFVYLSLGIMMLLFFLLNAFHYQTMKETFSTVSIRIHSNGVTLREIKNAIRDEEERDSTIKSSITAYKVEEHKVIKEEHMERERSISLYRIYGKMEQVLPMKLILGNYPYREDTFGCVLDKKTAFLLYGTYEVLGKTVTLDEKEYYIRGIVEDTVPVMLCQSDEENDVFWNLELSFPGEENGRTLAENYLLRHALTSDYTIVEGNYIVHMAGNLVGLPVTLLLVFFLSGRMKEIYRSIHEASYEMKFFRKSSKESIKKDTRATVIKDINKNQKRPKSVVKRIRVWISKNKKITELFITVCASIVILVWNLKRYFYFPKRFLPTKWSDFSHWSSIVREMKEHLEEILMLPPVKKDIVLLTELSETVAFTTLGILILGVLLGYYLQERKLEILAQTSGLAASEKQSQHDRNK